jgi:UDP-N-acetylmuramate dehydrogenase
MKFKENHQLKKYNTFGVYAKARYFVELVNDAQILELIQSENFKRFPKLILNGGSNILFTCNFDGLVIKLNTKGIELIEDNNDHVLVKAKASVVWDDLVKYCVDNEWGGLENLSMIPGNVGAAPIQNIGAYGVEQQDSFCDLEAINLDTGRKETFAKNACCFGYRDSIFKQELKGKYIITSVTYKLAKEPEFNTKYGSIDQELKNMEVNDVSVQAISDAVRRIRSSKLPAPEFKGNAGSFFKNPVIDKSTYYKLLDSNPGLSAYPVDKTHFKIAAGWLIDSLGWKGKRRGDAGVWHMQALVLVNHGNATGQQIFELATDIKNSVLDAYDIELEMEVNII